MPTFADQLKKIRLRKGWTQDKLAQHIGTSQDVISRYERGIRTPWLELLIHLCLALECSADELIGLKP